MARTSDGGSRGLIAILSATAVAGVSGYAIQLIAPRFLPGEGAYLGFAVFWSTMFLFGGAVGGIQQEVARATSPRASDSPRSSISRFALIALGVVAAVGMVAAVLLAPTAFRAAPVPLALAFVLGLLGYVLTAVLTGLLYGLAEHAAIAAMITLDAVLRGAGVVLGLVLGAPMGIIGFAIAVPFGLASSLVWLLARRRVSGRYLLDISTAQLSRNALSTVLAATAIGVVVTGLPLLFDTFLPSGDAAVIASLTLVVTVTRAPLIIPLMALQSYLVVHLRELRAHRMRRIMLLLGALAAVAAVGVALAVWLGPSLIGVISSGRYSTDPLTAAMVVVSAAMVAAMCVTGAGLLTLSRHRAYAAGWVVVAIASIALLWLPVLPTSPRALVALVVAPALGLMVHLIAVRSAAPALSDVAAAPVVDRESQDPA